MSISDLNGVAINRTRVRTGGVKAKFFDRKTYKKAEDDGENMSKYKENLMTANLGGESIVMYDVNGIEEPIDLRFMPKYGNIHGYDIIDGKYMIISFDKGHVVTVSMDLELIGQEIHSWHLFPKKEKLVDFCVCPRSFDVAVIGDASFKIIEHSCEKWRVMEKKSVEFNSLRTGQLSKVAWSPDGRILTVSTTTGRVYGFCDDDVFLRRWRRQWLRTIWKEDAESSKASQQSLFDFFKRYPGLRQLIGGIITLYAAPPKISGT